MHSNLVLAKQPNLKQANGRKSKIDVNFEKKLKSLQLLHFVSSVIHFLKKYSWILNLDWSNQVKFIVNSCNIVPDIERNWKTVYLVPTVQ